MWMHDGSCDLRGNEIRNNWDGGLLLFRNSRATLVGNIITDHNVCAVVVINTSRVNRTLLEENTFARNQMDVGGTGWRPPGWRPPNKGGKGGGL